MNAVNFDKVTAGAQLQGVSFSIPAGSVSVIYTPKQEVNDQLVRLILGLEEPEHGDVMVLGQRVASDARLLTGLRQRVAVVSSNGGLISNLKVWENVHLPLEYHGELDASVREERVERALKQVGYGGDLFALPGSLRLFERRLVGIARAIAMGPDVVIYNGILAGQSESEKSRIRRITDEFAAEDAGRTSLFITANPETVKGMAFASRVMLSGETMHDENGR